MVWTRCSAISVSMVQQRVAYLVQHNAQKLWAYPFTPCREIENNIRSLFAAPKGWAFIAADYAAMELHVLSHIAKEGNVQLAFNQGADLHLHQAPVQQGADQQGGATDRKGCPSWSFTVVHSISRDHEHSHEACWRLSN